MKRFLVVALLLVPIALWAQPPISRLLAGLASPWSMISWWR